jgi:ATP adenylyltransferase
MRDYDGTDYPSVESASSFAGVPDGFERLWTPHRIAYIEQPREDRAGDACVFCTAPSRSDEDALIVHRGASAYVILNLFPYNSGHLLVVPYRHVATYDLATDEETTEITRLTQTAMRVLTAVSHPHGFNIGMNQGAVAGAGIAEHLHQHLVPRWASDANFLPVIGQTKAIPQLLGGVRAALAQAWPST